MDWGVRGVMKESKQKGRRKPASLVRKRSCNEVKENLGERKISIEYGRANGNICLEALDTATSTITQWSPDTNHRRICSTT